MGVSKYKEPHQHIAVYVFVDFILSMIWWVSDAVYPSSGGQVWIIDGEYAENQQILMDFIFGGPPHAPHQATFHFLGDPSKHPQSTQVDRMGHYKP